MGSPELLVGPRPYGEERLKNRPNERLKGFELFLNTTSKGSRRSLRSIAQELGVTLHTVQYWRRVDRWDDRVSESLAEATSTAETTSQAIRRLVRAGVLGGLKELNRLSRQAEDESDRISATKALIEIAIKIEAITGAAGGDALTRDIGFKDDIDAKAPSERDGSGDAPEGAGPESSASGSVPEVPHLPHNPEPGSGVDYQSGLGEDH